MKTLMTSKLTRRCLILAVMILGLVYVASSDRYAKPVMAAQCCEGCPGAGNPTNGLLSCTYALLDDAPLGENRVISVFVSEPRAVATESKESVRINQAPYMIRSLPLAVLPTPAILLSFV